MPVSRSSTAERVKNGTQRQFQCRSHTVRGALCDRPCPSELLLRSVVYVKRSRPKCSTAVPRLPNAGADYLPVPRTVLTHVSQTWTVKRTVRYALKHSTGKNINKRVSKTQTRHTGTALFPGGGGVALPFDLHFRKLFLRATFASLIACLYLQSLKSYKASKLTMVKKYTKLPHIWPYGGRCRKETTAPCFERFRRADVKL